MNERKQKIIEEAIKLFAQKGYHSTSMQEIAERSGVSKGALYNYFHSKENLIVSVFKYYYDMLFEQTKNIATDELTAKEQFMKQLHMQFTAILVHQEFIEMQMKEQIIQVSEELQQFLFKVRAQTFNWYCERLLYIYGEQIAPYTLDCATMLGGMLKEYLFYIVVDKKHLDMEKVLPFVFQRMDAIAASFTKEEAPLLTKELLHDMLEIDEVTEQALQQRIYIACARLRELLQATQLEPKQQEQLIASLDVLQQEVTADAKESRFFIIEGILLYLQNQQIEQLRAPLNELTALIKESQEK